MITRSIAPEIGKRLNVGEKIIIVFGARQVGKTTLIKSLLAEKDAKILQVDGDRQEHVDVLSSANFSDLKSFVAGTDLLFIDEAQRIPKIGLNLKILHDQIPELKIIVTGSSALELSNRVREPMTGRTWTYRLYPISWFEWKVFEDFNLIERDFWLEQFLLFGSYPEILTTSVIADKQAMLREMTESTLYKDILMLSNIRYPEKLRQLLQLLAYQVGQLVSLQELGSRIGLSRDAVVNYIDLLEKSFVIFRLRGFSRNLRNEVTKMSKIYFYDLGIRNALINNFSPLKVRADIGQLWENFLIVERLKRNEYGRHYCNTYFWRLHTGTEIDYIEDSGGILSGFEFKWKGKARQPRKWSETYAESEFNHINKENFERFLEP